MTSTRCPARRAFTILELLIVIGIITVLAAMLLPAVKQAREQARAVQCQNNMKSLMQGILAFAAEHDNRLVGNTCDSMNLQALSGPSTPSYVQTDPSHWDFLFGQTGQAPQGGPLFAYVGNNYSVYLCPTQQALNGIGSGLNLGQSSLNATGPGLTSNGRFDYAIFTVFDGARVSEIPPTARMNYPDGSFDTLPTPVLVQEAPDTINGGNQEGHHDNHDGISHIHFGGGYYASVDGSVHWVKESLGSKYGYGAWVWTCQAPSGSTLQMGTCITTKTPEYTPDWAWLDRQ